MPLDFSYARGWRREVVIHFGDPVLLSRHADIKLIRAQVELVVRALNHRISSLGPTLCAGFSINGRYGRRLKISNILCKAVDKKTKPGSLSSKAAKRIELS